MITGEYSAELYWQSGSGIGPVIVLCGHALRLEQDEPATLTGVSEPSESGEPCYQLQLLQPKGHILLHGIASYWETGNSIDASAMVADWQVAFNFLAVSEDAERLSVNDFQPVANNHSTPWLPNILPRARNNIRLTGGGYLDDSPDNPRRPGRPFFDARESLLLVLPVTGKALLDSLALLASDFWRLAFGAWYPSERSAEEPAGYVIHIHTCDGSLTRFITRDEWRNLVSENELSASGILALLSQKDSDSQQQMERPGRVAGFSRASV